MECTPQPYTDSNAARSNRSSCPVLHAMAASPPGRSPWIPRLLALSLALAPVLGCNAPPRTTRLAHLETLLEHGHLTAVETESRDLLASNPNNPSLHLILARALLLQGRPQEALQPALQAADHMSGSPWPTLWSAIAYQRTQQWRQAEALWRECIATHPGFVPAYFFWGSALLESPTADSQLEQAAGYLALAAEEPGALQAPALNNLGLALWRMDRIEEAYRSLLQAVETNPRLLPARVNLALLAAGPMADHHTAINALTDVPWSAWQETTYAALVRPAFDGQALNASPAHVLIERDMAPYPQDQAAPEPPPADVSADPIGPFGAWPPTQPVQRAAGADWLDSETLGPSSAGAASPTNTLDGAIPPYPDLTAALTQVRSRERVQTQTYPWTQHDSTLRDRRRAQALLRQAMNLRITDPESPLVYNLYLRAIEADPSFPQAYQNLALESWRLSRTEEAILAMEHALSQDPTILSGRLQLADWLFQEGYAQEAAGHILIALRAEPDHPTAHFLAAQILFGDPRAKQLVIRSLEIAAAGPLPDSLAPTADSLLKSLTLSP